MRTIFITTLLTFLLFNFPSFATTKESQKKQNSSEKLVIKVKGMVCAFCAQGIEKNFNKLESVKETKVNLDSMEVTLKLKANSKVSKEEIEKVVTSAGFSFVGVKNEKP